MCVTNTEKTSEVMPDVNHASLDLEDEKDRRKHFTLLAKKPRPSKEADESTDAAATVNAHMQWDHGAFNQHCCDYARK